MEGMNIGFFINIRKEVDCKDNRFKNEESYVIQGYLFLSLWCNILYDILYGFFIGFFKDFII